MDLEMVNLGAGEPHELEMMWSEEDDIPLGVMLHLSPKELEMLGIDPWRDDPIQVVVNDGKIEVN